MMVGRRREFKVVYMFLLRALHHLAPGGSGWGCDSKQGSATNEGVDGVDGVGGRGGGRGSGGGAKAAAAARGGDGGAGCCGAFGVATRSLCSTAPPP